MTAPPMHGATRCRWATGGVTVDMRWKDGRLTEAVLRPALDGEIEVRAENAAGVCLDGEAVAAGRTEWGWKFCARAGAAYSLMFSR